MINAYNKTYLNSAMTHFGAMMDYVVYDLKMNLNTFWSHFIESDICFCFESGDPKVVAGMSGVEMALSVLGLNESKKKPKPRFDRSEEYWLGWALAYFQWERNLSFKKLNSYIKIDDILSMYRPYHEMDVRSFSEKLCEIYNKKKIDKNLKIYRRNLNISQKELSEMTNIPIRTLQQYEQGQKNINNAKAEYVLALSKALNCSPNDLLEI